MPRMIMDILGIVSAGDAALALLCIQLVLLVACLLSRTLSSFVGDQWLAHSAGLAAYRKFRAEKWASSGRAAEKPAQASAPGQTSVAGESFA